MASVEEKPKSKPPGRWARFARWLSWLYLAAMLGLWGLLELGSDVWWPATFLMYAPKWPFGLPLVILGPMALYLDRRLLGVHLAGLILLVGPVMNLCVPWHTFLPRPTTPYNVRVLTCNVHREQLDPIKLRAVIAQTDPDIVALQDWPGNDEMLVLDKKPGDGWHTRKDDVLFLASRFPIDGMEKNKHAAFSNKGEIYRYDLETTFGPLRFFNLHLATPRWGLVAVLKQGLAGVRDLEENTARRREQSALATDWIAQGNGPFLVSGDFNMSPQSNIYGDYWSPFTNAFSTAGWGWGHTLHTNRTIVRIDHILGGPGWQCRRCWVGPDVRSEHRPLIADMEWIEGR